MVRQSHGFVEEDHIKSFYNVDSYEDNYTAAWDGKTLIENIEFPEFKEHSLTLTIPGLVPVSIKTKKINCAVEMGDLMRNSTKTEDFLLTVGFWKGSSKTVVQRNFIYIPLAEWSKNFSFNLSNKMVNIFKDNNITNSYDDDLRWKEVSKVYKKEWNDSSSGLNIHFKRDHKNQRRVQCSIKKPYFEELVEKYSVSISERV